MEQLPEQSNGKHRPKKKTAESVRDKNVFTTGDVALICGISLQAVIRCFELPNEAEGKLKGFRIPGSTHRRIVRAELEKFMTKAGIPLEWLTGENVAIANDEAAQYSEKE